MASAKTYLGIRRMTNIMRKLLNEYGYAEEHSSWEKFQGAYHKYRYSEWLEMCDTQSDRSAKLYKMSGGRFMFHIYRYDEANSKNVETDYMVFDSDLTLIYRRK